MKLSSYLKELYKSIIKANETKDKELWGTILEEVDTFVSKWLTEEESKFKTTKTNTSNANSVTSPTGNFNITRSLPVSSESNSATDSSVIDKFNKDLLELFIDPEIPSAFHLELFKKLVPLIGPTRFFISWWPKVFQRWLSKPLKGDAIVIIQIIVDHLYEETKFMSEDGLSIPPNLFLLLDLYQQNHTLSKTLSCSNTKTIESFIHILENRDFETQNFTRTNLQNVLIEFGDKSPKLFFSSCSQLFKSPKTRIAVSELLLIFIAKKPDQTYGFSDSSLLEDLFSSLLFDHSLNALSLSVTLLTMAVPYICSQLPKLLRVILSILGRLMAASLKPVPEVSLNKESAPELYLSWEKLAETDIKECFVDIKILFSMLYGLFPCNIKEFVCSPLQLLKAEDIFGEANPLFSSLILESFIIEEDILVAGKALLSQHFIIPQMLTGDPHTELKNFSGISSFEPEEIISRCLSTLHGCLISEPVGWAAEQKSDHEPDFFKVLCKFTEKYEKSLTNFNQRLASLSLTPKDDSDSAPLESPDENDNSNVTLMFCELQLGSFLRHHQSTYIRKFHREKVHESSTEAERHSLYSTCRALQQEVKILKDNQEKIKAESNASQSKHIKWENELNQKLKHYRELTKELRIQNEELADKVSKLKGKYLLGERTLQDTQFELNNLKNQITSLESLSSQFDEKETQNKKLASYVAKWESEHEELLALRNRIRDLEEQQSNKED